MSTGGSSLEGQRKRQLESLKNSKACKCCEYYGTPCHRSNPNKNEAMQSQDQCMISSQDEEITLQGYPHEYSHLSKAQRLQIIKKMLDQGNACDPGLNCLLCVSMGGLSPARSSSLTFVRNPESREEQMRD